MEQTIIYLIVGALLGAVIGWFIGNLKTNSKINSIKEKAQTAFNLIDKEFDSFKATSKHQQAQQTATISEKERLITNKENQLKTSEENRFFLEKEKATLAANNNSISKILLEKQEFIINLEEQIILKTSENKDLSNELSTKTANFNAAKHTLTQHAESIEKQTSAYDNLKEKFNTINEHLATANAKIVSSNEKLTREKNEIKELRNQFNTEFQNIASQILKENTKSFSEVNESKIKELLSPLNKDIKEFKTKVEDVYNKESKERFSLGEKVKELAEKSEQISQDAINLTNALKGEAKTQGNWGEMILESILEKSGLRKDEEYFMEHELKDENGKAIRSDAEGKKMRPDAVIKYPDNRNVIIDSKVSLNAFTRYITSSDVDTQKQELTAHISAIKNHIVALSTKGYDDYDKSLDFVMMFIPSEPAYIAAMQGDHNLWNYAYDKRILLMNPTNLITSLKLIVDLWKREYQNQNSIAIADRGAKLYDKFVLFVENLEKVGKYIDNAQTSYNTAFKQLSTGNDNLVLQASKLQQLGIKNKKELSKELKNEAAKQLEII
ncbi:DNA recombination protein RmuC [Tenacibaculum finnmarkense]|uniref:DNA recombination protein RmuC n=1 Tax=Tenacibaculum finnmarkense TaxID=2781243 RepID=UPI001E336AEC|nr:DNA recombination protein RmuC [Tenacibaculum finnmarkense]MCD8402098.1 DNA recombination protein RmuC [Tenacibaculum finnmarkense genomovar finnmarkense]